VSVRIGIVDHGLGNRRSVQKAFEHVGVQASIANDRAVLEACDGLVIPGVGAFPRAMENLRSLDLVEFLRARAGAGTPILGICLGMQLLLDTSEEIRPTEGLGLIAGEVRWISAQGLRLPHIGWSEVSFERPSALTEGLPAPGCPFYHVHSLAVHPAQPEVTVGSTEYGESFATIVAQDNVFGVQFHAEKSSAHGLRLLENFVQQCTPGRAPALGLAPPA
jgi:glutamine amidotransferase